MREDYAQCYWLMLRARDLIAEALDQHIYAPDDDPDPDCEYMRWLKDSTAFLSGEKIDAVPHL